jgi:hypothetical protein
MVHHYIGQEVVVEVHILVEQVEETVVSVAVAAEVLTMVLLVLAAVAH